MARGAARPTAIGTSGSGAAPRADRASASAAPRTPDTGWLDGTADIACVSGSLRPTPQAAGGRRRGRHRTCRPLTSRLCPGRGLALTDRSAMVKRMRRLLATLTAALVMLGAASGASGSAPAHGSVAGIVPRVGQPGIGISALPRSVPSTIHGSLTFGADYESLIDQYFTDVAADSGGAA